MTASYYCTGAQHLETASLLRLVRVFIRASAALECSLVCANLRYVCLRAVRFLREGNRIGGQSFGPEHGRQTITPELYGSYRSSYH